MLAAPANAFAVPRMPSAQISAEANILPRPESQIAYASLGKKPIYLAPSDGIVAIRWRRVAGAAPGAPHMTLFYLVPGC